MATTPQSAAPEIPPFPDGPSKLTLEERIELIQRLREELAPLVPKTWDLDAELEAEHRAVLAGHDI